MLFDGLDLTLGAGDAALVSGPNGIGKSSLLRIAAGLLPPATGTVSRDGAVALLGEAPDPRLAGFGFDPACISPARFQS